MNILPLYDEVIADYEDSYNFRREAVIINKIGREERSFTPFSVVCMVRPIGTNDLTRQDKEGYRWEDQVRVHCRNNGSNDIRSKDLVFFDGNWYKLDHSRGIRVSDFSMFIGQMIKEMDAV